MNFHCKMVMNICAAIVILYSIVEICEAGQCTVVVGGVTKINKTCETGCCINSGGVGCCGEENDDQTNQNTIMETTTMSTANDMFRLKITDLLLMVLVSTFISDR